MVMWSLKRELTGETVHFSVEEVIALIWEELILVDGVTIGDFGTWLTFLQEGAGDLKVP